MRPSQTQTLLPVHGCITIAENSAVAQSWLKQCMSKHHNRTQTPRVRFAMYFFIAA
jgi:hypothetical protein